MAQCFKDGDLENEVTKIISSLHFITMIQHIELSYNPLFNS